MDANESLEQWVQREMEALLAIGDSLADATHTLQTLLRAMGDPRSRLIDDFEVAQLATITEADVDDARVDWYGSDEVPAEWKRLLDAAEVPGP